MSKILKFSQVETDRLQVLFDDGSIWLCSRNGEEWKKVALSNDELQVKFDALTEQERVAVPEIASEPPITPVTPPDNEPVPEETPSESAEEDAPGQENDPSPVASDPE